MDTESGRVIFCARTFGIRTRTPGAEAFSYANFRDSHANLETVTYFVGSLTYSTKTSSYSTPFSYFMKIAIPRFRGMAIC
ncbi:hypothetical protein SAMN04488127_2397 [Bhargavaea ginsengi]|uniref:Uncharacterized protein n=1 Tax=Bhargavaea ginsengi TaxID=426757 RepID=A0A1H7AR86_9BACL|nr:hypothetical protein SAMN04488127_2397 [Bhargavaea ginsengi]